MVGVSLFRGHGHGILPATTSVSTPTSVRRIDRWTTRALITSPASSRPRDPGAALLGATTRAAAAVPTRPCDGKHALCDGECCPGRCFVTEIGDCSDPRSGDCICREEVCCIGPRYIICGDRCCLAVRADGQKIDAPCTDPLCDPPREVCPPGAITGSYRRR